MDLRQELRATAAAAAAVVPLLLASPAAAEQPAGTPGSTAPGIELPGELPERPPGWERGPRAAIRIANGDPKVVETQDRYGHLDVEVQLEEPFRWQVSYFANGAERAQVLVDAQTGAVLESWTGHQVAWRMARGYEGSFGHVLNAPYVWLPLCALFLLGLFDWRRPWRIVHLDLLVLLSFGVSHFFFNRGEIGVSVPLAYPVLLYLLARMLWVGFRGRAGGLRPTAPIAWLAIATVFLLGFRIALNIADSGVIDVGYAGVIGADRILGGEPLYGEGAFPDDNPFGDTYGPVNYFAYVPFELVLPWSGSWDELAAARAGALSFDLAVVALLFVGGRRLHGGRRGRDAGVVLAFAWASYPYTAFVTQSNANDSLVAALVLGALLALASPAARGALTGLAALTKFAPLALAPLFAAGPRAGLASRDPVDRAGPLAGRRLRAVGLFAAALTGAGAVAMLPVALDPGLATFWERTVEQQVDRTSPFSIWGQEPGLEGVRIGLMAATAVLAVALAFLPRRRSLPGVAALAAAVLIAVQLTAQHWFYLYIVWFLPLLLVAITIAPTPGTTSARRKAGAGKQDL